MRVWVWVSEVLSDCGCHVSERHVILCQFATTAPVACAGPVFRADRERSRMRIQGVVEAMAEIAANPLPKLDLHASTGPMSKEALRSAFGSTE